MAAKKAYAIPTALRGRLVQMTFGEALPEAGSRDHKYYTKQKESAASTAVWRYWGEIGEVVSDMWLESGDPWILVLFPCTNIALAVRVNWLTVKEDNKE